MGVKEESRSGRTWALASMLVVVVLLVGHVLLVLRQFPVTSIRDGGLPVKGDVARYLATAEGVYRLGGVGIDTSAMAGYPVGTWNSIGKKGYELLGWLMPGVPLGLRFYVILVGLAIVLPLIYWIVAWRMVRPVPIWVVLIVCMIYWHLDSQVAFFWSFGNVLYPGTCLLIPLAVALAFSIAVGQNSALSAIGLGLLAGWVFYAHTVVELALAAPVAGVAIWGSATRRTAAPVAWISLSAAIAFGLGLPWLIELMGTRSDCVPQPQSWFQAGPKELAADLLSDRVHSHPFDRNFLLHVAVVAGIAGSALSWRIGKRGVAFVGMAGLWCLVVTYTFSYFPGLRAVQPYRFLIPAVVCLSVPSCVAFWEGWRIFTDSPLPSRVVAVLLAIIAAPAGTAYIFDLVQPPLPCGLPPDDRRLLDAIRDLPSTGRIVCEPDTVGHLIPLWCAKPVIGGLNDQAFLKQRFAGMNESGVLFGRPSESWGEVDLKRYLTAYAAEYIVVSSADWKDLAARLPTLFQFVERIGSYSIYRVKVDVGYILDGQGTVTTQADEILVSTNNSHLVLKFHYSDRFRAPAGIELEPIRAIADDPVPFLGVRIADSGTRPTTIEIRCR